MKSIKLTERMTLERNEEGFTIFSTIGDMSIIITDAPFERLKTHDEYKEWFLEQLIFLKTPENSIDIDEAILEIEKEIKK